MSKRIVELNCGDPKSNQQTASKVECVINVNNTVKHHSKPQHHSVNLETNDTTDCFDEESDSVKPQTTKLTKGTSAANSSQKFRDIPATGSVSSLYVARQIENDEPPKPTAAEGYIQTASRPTITSAEICASSVVKDVLLKGFNNLLTTNDTALIAQLVAAKKLDERKVVLIFSDLKALIGSIVRLVDHEFNDNDIRINVVVNDVEIGCCGQSKPTLVNPFNEIDSIHIGNQDLKIHQFEAYNTIEQQLGVSLKYVYSTVPDKVNNEVQV